mgnify:FL=1
MSYKFSTSAISISLGSTAPRIEEQLDAQLLRLDLDPTDRQYLQLDVDQVNRLHQRGVITETEARKARLRLFKIICKQAKKKL